MVVEHLAELIQTNRKSPCDPTQGGATHHGAERPCLDLVVSKVVQELKDGNGHHPKRKAKFGKVLFRSIHGSQAGPSGKWHDGQTCESGVFSGSGNAKPGCNDEHEFFEPNHQSGRPVIEGIGKGYAFAYLKCTHAYQNRARDLHELATQRVSIATPH